MMLPTRKRQIAEKLQNAGFNHLDFELDIHDNNAYKLVYKPVKAFFFEYKQKAVRYSPGQHGQLKGNGAANQWEDNFKVMQFWLSALKANTEAKDLERKVNFIQH